MALIQIGVIAKRNMETGQFSTALPLCKEIDTDQAAVDQKINDDITQILARKMSQYIDGIKRR